jgi:RNA polymerase subunit RPABC4/transcription elongation factor Spt4
MTDKPAPICGQHNVLKEWRSTAFEYTDEGISIRVPNVFAWVCPKDGEASFTPETVDELIATVHELIETAKRARARRPMFTEYVVAVN